MKQRRDSIKQLSREIQAWHDIDDLPSLEKVLDENPRVLPDSEAVEYLRHNGDP